MTKEEKRIKILEFLGWTDLKKINFGALRGTSPEGIKNLIAPNPLTNLNAIADAEKKTGMQTTESSIDYFDNLNRISCPHFASSQQRSDALIKTLNN